MSGLDEVKRGSKQNVKRLPPMNPDARIARHLKKPFGPLSLLEVKFKSSKYWRMPPV
jgi:hypothetical protein